MNDFKMIDFQFGKESDSFKRCKEDVEYLRTRSRHTEELEKEPIEKKAQFKRKPLENLNNRKIQLKENFLKFSKSKRT